MKPCVDALIPGGTLAGRLLFAVMAAAVSTAAFAANTWYVAKEDANAADTLDEGRGSEALPFRTIQAALDNPDFKAGDIVLVKRGDYDEGGAIPSGSYYQRTNRVYITKTVHLKSVEGRGVTRIVGKWGTTYPSYGGGADGIRCVQVGSAAAGTVVEGFTLLNGSAIQKAGGGTYMKREYSYGGGFYATGGMKEAYAVDCAFENCTAHHGGAAYGGTLVRCRLEGCSACINATTFYGTYAFACVAAGSTQTDSTTRYALGPGSVAVNCTFVDGKCYSYAEGSGVAYNCIFAGNTAQTYPETGLTNCVIDASSTNMAFASGLGDFRLIEGSSAIGAGDPSWRQVLVDLGVPSGYLEKDFAGETIDWTAAAVNAGAMMGESCVAEAPPTSRVRFSDDVYVDGKLVYANCSIRSATFPTNYEIRPADTSRTFCCYTRTSEGSSVRLIRPHRIWPGTNGAMRVVLPLKTSLAEMTYTLNYAAAEIWTDPVDGSDETGDGSEANPYETIQHALETVSKDFTVIRAKRGDYRKGGMASNGLMSRVNFNATAAEHVLVRAEEGPAVTTIWGAADPEAADSEIEPGCGTNAVRCVCALPARFSAIQGFTLRDGHTFATADEADANGYALHGAAVGTSNESFYHPPAAVLDCIITNCVAAGSIVRTAFTKRCRIAGNACGGKVFHCGFHAADIVENNRCAGILSRIDGNFYGRMWMVTAVGNTHADWADSFSDWDASGQVYASVFVGGRVDMAARTDVGNVTWDHDSVEELKATSVNADPLLANKDAGDYRPAVGGPAVDSIAAADISLFCYYLGSDFYGNPIRISPDGKLTAGAVQGPALPCKVSVAKSSDDVSLLVDGVAETVTRVVEPGTVVGMTLAADTSAARYARGYLLNGEERLFEGYPGGAVLRTVADGCIEIKPLVSTEWHVDAENGDDATGNGFTPGTAKRTLAEVFTNCAVVAGDTVYAHPGTYRDGEMRLAATSPTASRVIVPEDVTLKATGSAEETVILGAASDSEYANIYGMGTNAVRCVAMCANAVVDGFTLTGGRTLVGVLYDSDSYGAGVLGVSADKTALAKNCIITNNVAGYGGGGAYARYLNCRIVDNRAQTGNGGAIYGSGVVQNCVAEDNHGDYIIMYPSAVYNCTIGYNNKGYGVYFYKPKAESYSVFNSVIYRPRNDQSIYWNCAIGNDWTSVSESHLLHGTFSTNTAALKLDAATLRPAKDSPVVDAGDDEKRGSLFPETDIDGVPRVLNDGRFDIGACEYDWCKSYSKMLGRRVEVTDVTSNVVEVADAVRVPEGSLSLEWKIGTGCNPSFSAAVSGEGVLSIVLDGEPFASLGSGDGVRTFTLPTDAGSTVLDFQYSGDGYAELGDFSRNAGSAIYLR